jgi:hypothetical protein
MLHVFVSGVRPMPRFSRSAIPGRTFDLPPEWDTGEWELIEPIADADLADGTASLVMATLHDGTHIVAVTWPAGQRLARTGPPTSWSVQEHFTGLPPRHGDHVIERMWRGAIDALVDAIHDAARDGHVGVPPARPGRRFRRRPRGSTG